MELEDYGQKQDIYVHALLSETKQVSIITTMIRIDYLIHI